MWSQLVKPRVVLQGVSWLRNHLPHMPAHSRQSVRKNIIDRTHNWQQCSVTISEDILTTKYAFNLRLISPLSIDNSTNTLAGDWSHKVVRRACANQSVQSPSWHSFVKRHMLVASPMPPLHSIACDKRGQGNSLDAIAPTSPGDHNLVVSWHVVLWHCVYCAKNSTDVNEAGYPNVGNQTR